MDTSKQKYPYEMYCVTCNHVAAYLDHKPGEGEPIRSKGAILLNGEFPTPGSPINCDCQEGVERGWNSRERQERASVPIQACGECGSTTNAIVQQCQKCGCAVCEKCPDHEEKLC